MIDHDVLFMLLIGAALGLGKVLPRLNVKAAISFAAGGLVVGALVMMVFSSASDIPTGSFLIWLGICLVAGLVSSQMVLAADR